MLDDERPLIAVNGLLEDGPHPKLSLRNDYAEAVLKAGGIPLVLPPVGGPGDIARALDQVDGLLLTGGDDFDMERLGLGETHPAAEKTPGAKQDFDVELAKLALERGLPVLGICYGMQLLNLVEGGGLLQHLPDDRPGSQPHKAEDGSDHVHPVEVAEGTKLARLLEVRMLDVISKHHQAVGAPGRGWSVAATDAEGLIEAVERADHPFAVGVQWHPERACEGGTDQRLFRALVSAAGAYRVARRLGVQGANR